MSNVQSISTIGIIIFLILWLTVSITSSLWAINNLNRPRILLADDCSPSANRIRSPAFALRSSTSCSFFSGFRLDTSGPIPSSSPVKANYMQNNCSSNATKFCLTEEQRFLYFTILHNFEERQALRSSFGSFSVNSSFLQVSVWKHSGTTRNTVPLLHLHFPMYQQKPWSYCPKIHH